MQIYYALVLCYFYLNINVGLSQQVFTDEFNKKFMIQPSSTNNPTQQTIQGADPELVLNGCIVMIPFDIMYLFMSLKLSHVQLV